MITGAVIILVLCGCGNAQTITDANNAFAKHEIDRALQIYLDVVDSDASAEDRSQAAMRAGIIQWRYYNKYDEGRLLCKKGLQFRDEQSSLFLELSRLEENRKNHAEALDAAMQGVLLADTSAGFRRARIRYAYIIVIAHAAKMIGLESTLPSAVEGLLPRAHDISRIIVEAEPGDLPSSISLLLSSILLGDGQAALEGWQSYFRISEGTSAGRILDEANEILAELLPEWDGEKSDVQTTVKIVRALSDSRMFIPAATMAIQYIPKDQQPEDVPDIVSYALFTRKAKDLTDEYYRKTAIGEGNYDGYFAAFLSALKSAWEQWHWTGDSFPIAEPFTSGNVRSQRNKVDDLRKRMKDRFGAYVGLGRTAGYNDLHYGHAVIDETRTIEQYGKKGEITFILLDRMVSNGFQSWAWYYRSQHGGWASEDAIYQVRSAYTGGPMSTWQTLTDPTMYQKEVERIEKLREEDIDIANGNSYAYLPGMRAALRFNDGLSLYNRLKGENLSGTALMKGFVAELERIVQDYSIFAHEGRHVIDKRDGIKSSEELEFRAKLSEIAFAEYPKMAFAGGIYGSNLGGKTPHGQANLRIVKGLVAWMEDHKSKIAEFDQSKPTIMQVDKLTDEQLVTAIQSMDPLLKN